VILIFDFGRCLRLAATRFWRRSGHREWLFAIDDMFSIQLLKAILIQALLVRLALIRHLLQARYSHLA
jgi:hypothetical protein